jgi:hypothetical protein
MSVRKRRVRRRSAARAQSLAQELWPGAQERTAGMTASDFGDGMRRNRIGTLGIQIRGGMAQQTIVRRHRLLAVASRARSAHRVARVPVACGLAGRRCRGEGRPERRRARPSSSTSPDEYDKLLVASSSRGRRVGGSSRARRPAARFGSAGQRAAPTVRQLQRARRRSKVNASPRAAADRPSLRLIARETARRQTRRHVHVTTTSCTLLRIPRQKRAPARGRATLSGSWQQREAD